MATRIMVINDTKEILELFEMILTDEGYEVILSSYGVEEIRSIEDVKPDLLILDYTVGTEKNGWQLLQKLKMNRPTARIPVILCSTEIRLAKEIEGYLLSKGISVVPKPFDIEDLLSAINHALDTGPALVSEQIVKDKATKGEKEKPRKPHARHKSKKEIKSSRSNNGTAGAGV